MAVDELIDFLAQGADGIFRVGELNPQRGNSTPAKSGFSTYDETDLETPTQESQIRREERFLTPHPRSSNSQAWNIQSYSPLSPGNNLDLAIGS